MLFLESCILNLASCICWFFERHQQNKTRPTPIKTSKASRRYFPRRSQYASRPSGPEFQKTRSPQNRQEKLSSRMDCPQTGQGFIRPGPMAEETSSRSHCCRSRSGSTSSGRFSSLSASIALSSREPGPSLRGHAGRCQNRSGRSAATFRASIRRLRPER